MPGAAAVTCITPEELEPVLEEGRTVLLACIRRDAYLKGSWRPWRNSPGVRVLR